METGQVGGTIRIYYSPLNVAYKTIQKNHNTMTMTMSNFTPNSKTIWRWPNSQCYLKLIIHCPCQVVQQILAPCASSGSHDCLRYSLQDSHAGSSIWAMFNDALLSCTWRRWYAHGTLLTLTRLWSCEWYRYHRNHGHDWVSRERQNALNCSVFSTNTLLLRTS